VEAGCTTAASLLTSLGSSRTASVGRPYNGYRGMTGGRPNDNGRGFGPAR